ncbi:TonB-dependent receptor [Croceicoccus mobilis]|uniref:TonB-dependent receptor n=1 Tax=Croceicoccus mobilis TaxID=1703339 RepID=A0A917DWC9_9SPHN|nr:TonB-dependent receptor [Croceicoccus mobilis]GGD77783.1 TonB-dependent receptor [Croceicoccus mobilis]
MKKFLLCSSAIAAIALPATAHAQSTGSLDFEDSEIVVTGTVASDVAGVEIPDSPKAKVEISSEIIQRQIPGQTINDTLNLVPGVSFTNNDPFGSLGGSFTVRGFGADRISQTLDGIPLNDSGGYALYTNQMLDPEIIEAATVSLGSTDVDSPTASAAGGTINIRSKMPDNDFGVTTVLTYGDIIARGNDVSRMMYRGFIKVETGEITPGGLKAYFTASTTQNDSTFSNYGGVKKQQYNGKIYQPLGDNGDFIAVAGHYNQNRNNFNGSPARYSDPDTYGIQDPADRFYDLYDGTPCSTDEPEAGVADSPNSCGSPFERRFNPSNTGNIRANARFTLSDKLVLTVDPSYQYVKANGGGTSSGGYEYADPTTGLLGQIDGSYYAGVDLNGDGDTLDRVRILTPSQTQTDRFVVIANLAYELNDFNRFRLSYTFDHADHRQTGQAGLLQRNGVPYDVFPVNDPIVAANGLVLNKRDRKSVAMLNQVAGEYRGEFGDLTVLVGARMPFFERKLDQRCYNLGPDDGYGDCIAAADAAIYEAAYPDSALPEKRTRKYDKFLPSAGLTYNFTPEASVFVSYAKNLSVPGTDTLYGSLYYDETDPRANPTPETSDAFDVGLRFQSNKIQAQIAGWYSKYNNRLISVYYAECDCSVSYNLGTVDKYGIDGSIAYKPIDALTVYAFGSWQKSEIKDDVVTSTETYATAGKREAGAPKYMIGGRIQGDLGPVQLGAQAKRTGMRYLNDINTVTLPGYTTVDADIRVNLGYFEENLDKAYLQFNVTNIFDEVYIGSASGGLTTPSSYVNIGAPRAFTASLIWGF